MLMCFPSPADVDVDVFLAVDVDVHVIPAAHAAADIIRVLLHSALHRGREPPPPPCFFFLIPSCFPSLFPSL